MDIIYVCLPPGKKNLNRDPRFQMMVDYLRRMDSNLILWMPPTPPAIQLCQRLLDRVQKVKCIDSMRCYGPDKRDDFTKASKGCPDIYFIDKILHLYRMVSHQIAKLNDNTTLVIVGHPRELTGLVAYQMYFTVREIVRSSIRISPFSVMTVCFDAGLDRSVFIQSHVAVPLPSSPSSSKPNMMLSDRFAQINRTKKKRSRTAPTMVSEDDPFLQDLERRKRRSSSRKARILAHLDAELDAHQAANPRYQVTL